MTRTITLAAIAGLTAALAAAPAWANGDDAQYGHGNQDQMQGQSGNHGEGHGGGDDHGGGHDEGHGGGHDEGHGGGHGHGDGHNGGHDQDPGDGHTESDRERGHGDGHAHDGAPRDRDDEHGHAGGGHDFALGRPGSPADVDRTVEIRATEMRFQPEAISVTPGETVRFVVHNEGQLRHAFLIGTRAEQRAHEKRMQDMSRDELAAHNDPNMLMLAPGETETLVWRFGRDVDGKARFACHVPGHYQAGMRGRFRFRGGN